ncbi:PAP-specific phosphatase HAL2-like isoform 2 [Hibiscus syriacus]|uniref:3'(2'),5'-bisphosphate nucleotidase n=1 Tax=Hibiscus syriacus TaxID=106335 RepID=A0A6A3CXK1_HIBSY|nr:PAP-specific phosphatase HAL2-like isoform 2 [Hibiscus syriacus]
MALNSTGLVFRAINILGQTRITNTKKLPAATYVETLFPWSMKKTNQKRRFRIVSQLNPWSMKKTNQKRRFRIVSQLKFNQNHPSLSSSVMKDERNLVLTSPGPDRYSKELDVAVRAIQMACSLCQKIQDSLILKTSSSVHSKDDNSPVTVAAGYYPNPSGVGMCILAEEDVRSLFEPNSSALLAAVVKTVNGCLTGAPHFGFKGPETPLGSSDVLEAIIRRGFSINRGWRSCARCSRLSEPSDEEGMAKLSPPLLSKLTPTTSESWDKGCVIYARRGRGEAWMQPLQPKNKPLSWPNSAIPVRVSSVDNPALATFCEPVEKSNSSHSFTAGLAQSVGLRKKPLRVHSMVKYAAIAQGDAEIFMKFARTGYKEKIWGHAAGVIIIEEAGGVVTDAGGSRQEFSRGMFLEGLDRGIIACCGVKLHERIIGAVDASWNSSSL